MIPYVTTFEEMRQLDQATIEGLGVPGVTLMENAGKGAAEVAAEMLPHGRAARVAVVAGPGNNGGDGYVVARHLAGQGHDVVVYLIAPTGKVGGDALLNLDAWKAMSGRTVDASEKGVLAEYREEIERCDLIVDAIFGTGLTREVRSPYREAIELLNASVPPILALDLPSGLDGDRGRVLGAAVEASVTVTFGFAKRSHFLFPGARHRGRLEVVDIGIPEEVVSSHPPGCALSAEPEVATLFPVRPRDAHKGTFGHLVVVGGGAGKTGASLMAARAALRSGVGLVTLAAPESGWTGLDQRVVEEMTVSLGKRDGAPAAEALLEVLADKQALVIGPGLGQSPGVLEMLRVLLPKLRVPAVLDADALNTVSGELELLASASAPLVLTPHPGEMARLTARTTAEIQGDRIGTAERFAREHSVTMVLKGAHSVIAGPEGTLWLNSTGNPGMASGGMGDVLAGIIGALLAQGMEPLDAARLGAYAHGAAADDARVRVGEAALIASDVIASLGNVWRRWEKP